MNYTYSSPTLDPRISVSCTVEDIPILATFYSSGVWHKKPGSKPIMFCVIQLVVVVVVVIVIVVAVVVVVVVVVVVEVIAVVVVVVVVIIISYSLSTSFSSSSSSSMLIMRFCFEG